MQTPRNISFTQLDNGLYRYIGIRNNISSQAHTEHFVILIDGLPLFKSSKEGFWTILGYLETKDKPFPIAIFGGKGKPNISHFLGPLVEELLLLSERGIIDIKKVLFLGDAPARAYIKCVKGHSGYSSCDRCEEDTEQGSGIVHSHLEGTARTDESFRLRAHLAHHLGEFHFCFRN